MLQTNPDNPLVQAPPAVTHLWTTPMKQPTAFQPSTRKNRPPGHRSPDMNNEPYNNEYLATQAQLGDLLEEISQRLTRNNIHSLPEPTAHAKLRAPDTFNGSDPQKLDTFILQCSLYITLR
jgi:hypothetical protein